MYSLSFKKSAISFHATQYNIIFDDMGKSNQFFDNIVAITDVDISYITTKMV